MWGEGDVEEGGYDDGRGRGTVAPPFMGREEEQ